jgi:hypothetical protein
MRYLELNRENLSKVIRKLSQTYTKKESCTIEDINSGLCDDFAVKVLEHFFESDLVQRLFFTPFNGAQIVTNAQINKNLDDHVWIIYDGLHYDAEAPDGVRNYKDLPIYKRQFSKNKLIEIIQEEIRKYL